MPVLQRGEVVEGSEGRWQVERKIGEGQFSEVYHVQDCATQEQVKRRQWRRGGSGSGGSALCVRQRCLCAGRGRAAF